MRIAQIAPLWEPVHVHSRGPVGCAIGLLTDELISRGHEVTLFAPGDSDTLAWLEAECPTALDASEVAPDEYFVYEQMQLSNVFKRASAFDIIHAHVGYAALPYARFSKTPVLHTLHQAVPSIAEKIYSQHRRQNFVSVAETLKQVDLRLNYVATVRNAIATDHYRFYESAQAIKPYLAFIGELSANGGIQQAIEIAKQGGWRLKIAGQIAPQNKAFFEKEVRPHIDDRQITFFNRMDVNGEPMSCTQRNELLGGAVATVFPASGTGSFETGIVESLASGTPVVGLSGGPAEEVIVEGSTGFLCQDVDACVSALETISRLDRAACRRYVTNHLSVQQMADGYEAAYRKLRKDRFVFNGSVHVPRLIAS